MSNAARLLMILAVVAATGRALRADEPPLTPVELAKIGSVFPKWHQTDNLPPNVLSALNVPFRPTGTAAIYNGIWHHFDVLPDGGLILSDQGATGVILFRLDAHLRLVSAILWRPSNNAIETVPDVPGGLRAELLFWAHTANWNTNRLPK